MRDLFRLDMISAKDPRLVADMAVHYSQPKGFVGRSICYAVMFGTEYWGAIVGGSASRHLPGRKEFLGGEPPLNNIVNNTFFHITAPYPFRNFASHTLRAFEKRVQQDWLAKYGDPLLWAESLVELPRAGEVYLRCGYSEIGKTKGQTCKRVAGKGTDSWSGKRVWDTVNLRPKRVFFKELDT